MENKTRTMVNIAGKEYAIAGAESEEYIHSVAIYVDRKMAETSQAYPGLTPNMLGVLVALNIADELIKKKKEYTELEADYLRVSEELKKLKIEYTLAKDNKKEQQIRKPVITTPGNRIFDTLK